MIAVEHELSPGDPASVALGRTVVSRIFTDSPGCPAVLDDAVLAVSELVTNAVVVAHDRICLTVELLDGLARIAVYDDGPGNPATRPSSPDRADGRGLSIVEVIASRWGVRLQPPGKWVWAEFPVQNRVA